MFKEILKKYPKILIFPTFIFLLILILTAFKINGSSVNMYNRIFYGDNFKDPNLLLGKSRSIRSDEWLVETPLNISQTNVNFADKNSSIGIEQEMNVLSSAPTKHWSSLFKPQNWSFFVLPTENAFAFKWWFRGFLLIVGSYLLIFTITKNKFLSISAGLFMFFTPFVQWWYSTGAVESLAYSFFAIFFALRILGYKNYFELFLNSLFLTYFSICFALLLYPPFQVPLSWLGMFIVLGAFLQQKSIWTKTRLISYGVTLAVVLLVVASVLAAYYLNFRDIISIIRNTDYPGVRVATGGGFEPLKFFGGFYDILLLRNKPLPPFWGNQSEASNSFFLLPFLLPFLAFYSLKSFFEKKKIDFIYLGILIFSLAIFSWLLIGFPHLLAKITLFSLSPNNRTVIGLIAANMIAIFYFLGNFRVQKDLDYKITAAIAAFLGFFLYFYFGSYLKLNYPDLINGSKLIALLISSFAGLLIYLLLVQKKRAFVLLLLGYSVLSTLLVNPLYRGLDPIINSPLQKEIGIIEKTNTNNSRWVVYDNIILGNFLIASGVNSINSTHLYPQFDLWEKFDPNKKYKTIWNRYAHVAFTGSSDQTIKFSLNQLDVFTVEVNPCNQVFKTLAVRYFVFNKIDTTNSCLKEIKRIESTSKPLYIYEQII